MQQHKITAIANPHGNGMHWVTARACLACELRERHKSGGEE